MQYDALIVGAGLSGAATARRLMDAGARVLVLERRGFVGGMAATTGENGTPVQRFGPHVFHTRDAEAWRFMNRFARFDTRLFSPMALSRGEGLALPFNMNTFFALFGTRTIEAARARIARERLTLTHPPRNLEERALSSLGETVYERLVRHYTEKQWGRPCAALPPELLGRLPLRFSYDNRYFGDPWQGLPLDGYTPLVSRMLAGATLCLNTDFLADAAYFRSLAPCLYYTGALDEYFSYAYGPLAYRSLRFEAVEAEKPLAGVAVLNHTDETKPYTRSMAHAYLYYQGPLEGSRCLVHREYPLEWQRESGLDPFYPLPDEENRALYARYAALSDQEQGTYFLGRLASYSHLNMDGAVKEALKIKN